MGKVWPSFTLNWKSDLLRWNGQIDFNSQFYELVITYPLGYPLIQPEVEVFIDVKGKMKRETFREVKHVYTDGILCLYPWDEGTDSWKTKYTVIDVIDKFLSFLEAYASQDKLLDFHYSDDASISNSQFCLIISPFELGKLRFDTQVTLSGIMNGSLDAGIILSKSLNLVSRGRTGKIRIDEGIKPYLDLIENKVDVEFRVMLLMPKIFNKLKELKSTESFKALFPGLFKRWKDKDRSEPTFFINKDNSNEIIGLTIDHRTNRLRRIRILHPGSSDYLFSRTDSFNLSGKFFTKFEIILIGLGSLGGSLAMNLAKTGFTTFTLIDPDLLDSNNIGRHILGIDASFNFKVSGIKNLILQTNPLAIVDEIPETIFYQGVIEKLILKIKNSDKLQIIISTTGDDKANLFIDNFARSFNITGIFSFCSNNSEMGRIFRIWKNKQFCYTCFLLHEKNNNLTPFPATTRSPYENSLPGMFIDIATLSGFISRFVFQTSLLLADNDITYPNEPNDFLTINLEHQDISKMRVIADQLDLHPKCRNCSYEEVELDENLLKILDPS